MNKDLKELVKLSNIDKEINNFVPKIQKEQQKLDIFVDSINKLTNKIDALHSEIEDLQSQKKKNEEHIVYLKEKLDNISKKINEVKKEKEFEALKIEEDIAKGSLTSANEEIVRIELLLERKTEELSKLQEELQEEENSLKEMEIIVNKAIKDIEEDRNKFAKEREEIVNNIDKKVIVFYEKIRRWANDTAIVPVRKQACYGCFLTINDKVYSEIIKGEEIVTCPHCGRILYKEEE